MDDRFNTIAGWTLFAGIVALGLSSVSAKFFEANKNHRPEKMGFEIEGVVSSEGGGEEAVPIENLLATADVAKGEAVFAKCKSCHTIDAGGANGIGPNLHGVVGKPVGGHAGFAFSDALKGHGGKWDWTTMDAWLHNPKKFAPGTKMTFAGLGKPEDRANLIAYLNSQGSNLPLPAAVAAPAADAAAAPAEGDAAVADAGEAAGAGDDAAAGATAAAEPAAAN